MKRFLYTSAVLLLILCNSFHTKAQFVAIPDTNFVNWLNANGYAGCMNGNLMDTTCNAIVSAKSVDCSSKGIKDLEGIQYFDSLITLTCAANSLNYLPNLPPTLTTLNCGNNSLSYLPSLPSTLTSLSCYSNFLTSLPNLPQNLNFFRCNNNSLAGTLTIPSPVIYLDCSYNQFTNLYFANLISSSLVQSFNCSHNQIYSIPQFSCSGGGNSVVDCSYNQISIFPNITGAFWVYCNNNQISSVNSSFNEGEFNCSNNQITTLSPNNMSINLNCSNNLLTTLPLSFNYNSTIDCSNNLITDLTVFSYSINCSNNHLTSLTLMNSNYTLLNIANNPNLTCLTPTNSIGSFYWSNTAISCLPNAIHINSASPSIAGLPLCQPASGCNYFWNMYGIAFNDLNSNCIVNIGESKFRNIPLKLDSNSVTKQIFYTNNQGYYSFETGLGNYEIKIDTTDLPFDVICPAGGLFNSVLTMADSLDADLNFGLKCKTGYIDLIALGIAPSARLKPGGLRTLYLKAGDAARLYGASCANGISGSVKAVLDGPVTFISAAPGALTPSIVSGDTIIWNVANFALSNPNSDFNIRIQIDTTATGNDTLCVSLEINTATAEINYTNNLTSLCFPILNSFDPNAKDAYPVGIAEQGTNDITYTIYFQNTGNAPAENIYILDTLDDDLNGSSFRFLSSSHDPVTQLLAGNIVRFSFPGINLPDSTSDEPGSHGYVQFKISKNTLLPKNEIISNKANIYFDLNPAVITNEVNTMVNFDTVGIKAFVISDSTICENEILTAQHIISFPYSLHYTWFLDSMFIDTTSSINFSGLSVGQHQITLVIYVSNLVFSSTKTVIVYPKPIKPIIAFNGDTLSTIAGQGYQWYLFYTPIFGATQSSWLISQNGWYKVLIIDSNGCSERSDSVWACKSSKTMLVSDSTICPSQIITAHNIAISPYPLQFNWSLDSTSFDTTSSVILSGLLSGYHQLTLSINGGTCNASYTKSILVFPLTPKPIITIKEDTLKAPLSTSYQWFWNSNPISWATHRRFPIPQSGWYSVLITDSNGCSTLSDSVYACKSANLMMVSDTAICTDENFTASNITISPFQLSYNWQLDTVFVDTTLTITLSSLTPGIHQLTLTIDGGTCHANETRSIMVFADPSKPSITINGNTLTSTIATTYQWHLNNNTISGATQNQFVIPQSGWYTVLIADSNGCNALSDSIYISGVGIAEYANSSINLYPNPASETITITTTTGNFIKKEIQIFNSLGEIVFNASFTGVSKILNLHNFANGLYLFRLKNDKSYSYQKFVKE